MKKPKKRPRGAATPMGHSHKQTVKNNVTLRILFYNSDDNQFAEATLIFKSIYDLAKHQTLIDKYINQFLKLYGITEDQLEICIHV